MTIMHFYTFLRHTQYAAGILVRRDESQNLKTAAREIVGVCTCIETCLDGASLSQPPPSPVTTPPRGLTCYLQLALSMYWRASSCLARISSSLPSPRRASTTRNAPPASDSDSSWPHPIASSSILVRSKSTFEAFASRLPHHSTLTGRAAQEAAQDDAARLIAHLKATISRTRRATHAMWAWRRGGESRAEDGGEAGAGERLERLLEADVVLVVFRWYGGVPLGSHRWKCISQVAKEALTAGQFRGGKGGGGSKGKQESGRRKR